MRLSMIAVEESDTAKDSAEIPFRWLAHHVHEIFLALLPRDFVLDGSGNVQITCGPGGDEPRYSQVLGTSNLIVESFDFQKFRSLPGRDRDTYLLQVLEQSFVEIASMHNNLDAVEIIRAAAREVEEKGFSLMIKVQKLCKTSPSRRFRAEVFRHLNRDVGEGWCVRLTRTATKDYTSHWMTDRPAYLNRTDYFAKAEWTDNQYIVRNRLGKPVFDVEVPVHG